MKITQKPSQQQRVMTAPTGNKQPEQAIKQTRTEHERDQPVERVPFGTANQKLNATCIPGMHLHWINDWHPAMPNRLAQALASGYKFVSQEEVSTAALLGKASESPTTDLSTRVSRIVGARPDGAPITSYLMKIREDWHLEHQQPALDRADMVEDAIRRGQFERQKDDRRYVPRHAPINLTSKLEAAIPSGTSEGEDS